MEYIILWIGLSIAIGFINQSRGNGFITGLLLSLILSPLIGFIIVIVTKENTAKLEKAQIAKGKLKKCPKCAEVIKSEAVICKHCGHEFNELV